VSFNEPEPADSRAEDESDLIRRPDGSRRILFAPGRPAGQKLIDRSKIGNEYKQAMYGLGGYMEGGRW
jgi:hypothetical protein